MNHIIPVLGGIILGAAYSVAPEFRHNRLFVSKTETIAISKTEDFRHVITTNVFGNKQEWDAPYNGDWLSLLPGTIPRVYKKRLDGSYRDIRVDHRLIMYWEKYIDDSRGVTEVPLN